MSERADRGASEAAATVEPLLLGVPAALRVTGLGRSKLLSLVASGDIPSVKIGSRRLIPLAGLREWVERQCQTA